MLRKLKQTRQRYRLQLFLISFAAALALLASLGVLALLALRFIPGLAEFPAASARLSLRWLLPAAGLLALAFSGWRSWRHTPTLQETARRADLHFGLGERLSTSLETAGESRPSVLLAALQGDAEAAADRVIPARIAPLRLPATLGWWLASSLLAVSLLQLRQADGFLLLPPTRPAATAPGNAVDQAAVDSAAAELQDELLAQLLDQPPETHRDALQERGPAATHAAVDAQHRDGQREPQQAAADPGGQTTQDSADRNQAADDATRVDQTRDGAAAQAAADPAAEASPAAADIQARNDGSTNPAYGPDATRDQELREQARRQQERAGNPGGGGGDQAALADSSVAGDATASFEGNEAGIMPDTTEQGDELSLPEQVRLEGDRIEVELPPEASATQLQEAAPATISWSRHDRASLLDGREELRLADRELLQRYHSLVREGNAQADGQPGTP